jgi:2-beta-glucuronyltransferase
MMGAAPQIDSRAPVSGVRIQTKINPAMLRQPTSASTSAQRLRAVIVSEHDYRTKRRANMHPIADALVALGWDVAFVSVRFSPLSRIKRDSRSFLWKRANVLEPHNGVGCYLWKTPFHPVHTRIAAIDRRSAFLYRLYARLPSRELDDILRGATAVIVESGLGAMLIDRIRAQSPDAIVSYLASDELATVGVHPYVQQALEGAVEKIDHVCLPSPRMAESFAWAADRLFHVPHGLNVADYAQEGEDESPYVALLNAVSVGSMLFDPQVILHAAQAHPDMQFHVIGCGTRFDTPANVRIYDEMPFKQTITYLRHATVGIAPYRRAPGCDYLCDTSMKLMQYEYLGLPAVCPEFAVGGRSSRFGYTPGDYGSIAQAFADAKTAGRTRAQRFLGWEDVAQRLVNPRAFADTAL